LNVELGKLGAQLDLVAALDLLKRHRRGDFVVLPWHWKALSAMSAAAAADAAKGCE
jgi:hypothetical protein